MGAEGNVGRCLRLIQPDTGFEPLPLGIEQRDQRDGRLHRRCGKSADPVEVRIDGRVERVEAVKHGKPVGILDGATDAGRQCRHFLDSLIHQAPKFAGLPSSPP
ncbi:hypothetical protein MESS4_280076 [Mesorhizobium sp. STM 4661]|nr:hypothetical protein MESS4_280076 [Mesorhizobium sp. STM 4661]